VAGGEGAEGEGERRREQDAAFRDAREREEERLPLRKQIANYTKIHGKCDDRTRETARLGYRTSLSIKRAGLLMTDKKYARLLHTSVSCRAQGGAERERERRERRGRREGRESGAKVRGGERRRGRQIGGLVAVLVQARRRVRASSCTVKYARRPRSLMRAAHVRRRGLMNN
jgi:hypothetical protein